MKVILYFDEPRDLTQDLRAIREVSKKVGKISVTLTAREKSVFNLNGQNIFVDTLNKLAPNDFDCLICSDKSSAINFPPEKIFTPEQFIKNFSNNTPPPNYFFLLMRMQNIMSSPRFIRFLHSRRIPKPSSKLFFRTTMTL